ncbi:MAG TPA: hypothetical protein VMA86_00735 [Acetobacteraceae bacterium]|nr:hypothetical protein [Acetobacteraceae bacterium]
MPLLPATLAVSSSSSLSAFSPLVLIDRLITLAEEADRAGMDTEAGDLLRLAFAVGEEPPPIS